MEEEQIVIKFESPPCLVHVTCCEDVVMSVFRHCISDGGSSGGIWNGQVPIVLTARESPSSIAAGLCGKFISLVVMTKENLHQYWLINYFKWHCPI